MCNLLKVIPLDREPGWKPRSSPPQRVPAPSTSPLCCVVLWTRCKCFPAPSRLFGNRCSPSVDGLRSPHSGWRCCRSINIKWVLKEGSAFPVSLISLSRAHCKPPLCEMQHFTAERLPGRLAACVFWPSPLVQTGSLPLRLALLQGMQAPAPWGQGWVEGPIPTPLLSSIPASFPPFLHPSIHPCIHTFTNSVFMKHLCWALG